MNKGIKIGIPFHVAAVAAFTEAGNIGCNPCFKAISALVAMTEIKDGHRAIFDAFTLSAQKLGYTGKELVILKTSASLMGKDHALITKTFGISEKDLKVVIVDHRQPYEKSILTLLQSLADTNADKQAFQMIAQLVGEVGISDHSRSAILNALCNSAKTLNLLDDDKVVTAASAVMWLNPSIVSQKLGVDVVRIRDIIAGLQTKLANVNSDMKHVSSQSSSDFGSSSKSDKKHGEKQKPGTQIPPKSAPAHPEQRMTGGARS